MPPIDPMLEGATEPSVSPFELLLVLWRRRLVLIATIFACVVVAAVLSLRSAKSYSASSQLLFRDPGFAQTVGGGGELFSNGQEEPQRTTQTSIDVVTSANVASEAESLLLLKEPVGDLIGSISVTPNSNADIATITATRSSPREAANVANAFAEGYIIYRRRTDRETITQAEELVKQSLTTASSGEQVKLEESLRQLGVLRALQTGDAEVIARAQPNDTPVSPKPKRDIILGLVVGIVLGCGAALLTDRLDRRLSDLEDFERAFPELSIIASVPHKPAHASMEQLLAGPTGESYRMLRESLRFLDPTGLAQCFVVTSAIESEGKSTVAVNLASSLAAVGRKVILVESDMRRPTAAMQLELPAGVRGLSDLLVSGARAEEFLVTPDREPGLLVLPSGTIPPNSADLLSAGRMGEVLQELREAADIVIVDCPPLLPVADTRVLLRLAEVDGVILVARAGLSRRDRVTDSLRVLRQSNKRVFGLVITDVKTQPTSSYYYDEPPSPPSRPQRANRQGKIRLNA
ncbi:MAG TPA: polysaccharide biosynthesis tyrosine autokinase [Solirubrobacteraceae bacterium]|nr:polysaccharide biosynthesis tyrosine autokinase [Solirubrobacteraceae bacterium]